MEVPTVSITLNPAIDLIEECTDPGVIVAIVELEPKTFRLCQHNSVLCKKNNPPVKEKQASLKLEILLKEISHILQAVTSYEDIGNANVKVKSCEKGCCFYTRSLSNDASSVDEKVREPDKQNKVFVNNLTGVEKEKNLKKQEKIWKSQNTKDSKSTSVRQSRSDSEPINIYIEAQGSKTKVKQRSASDGEDNTDVAQNMEQLLQEVEHWYTQHTELNDLIKTYQKSQKNLKTTSSNPGISPTNSYHKSTKLEEEVNKLKNETYSLNLFATMLDNECRILQQRIELFKELHQQPGWDEKLPQKSPELKKDQASSETEKEIYHTFHKVQETKGAYPKKEKVCASLDFCCDKKACNNQLNLRIARKVLWGRKRHPSNNLK